MNKHMLRALILGAVGLVQGCSGAFNTAGSGDFACPGMPGVICKTPAEVYKMSHGDTLDPAALSKTSRPSSVTVPGLPASQSGVPVPLRTQAVVMRTWIAPWKDKNDDLHWPSYIYTEIEGRKWAFGNQDFTGMSAVIPYKTSAASVKGGKPSAAPQSQQPESFVDDLGISKALQLP